MTEERFRTEHLSAEDCSAPATEERFRTAADLYRVGLTAAIEAIEAIEGWDTPEDEALTADLLATLRECLTQGDAFR